MTIFKWSLVRGLRNSMSLVCNGILPLALILVRNFWVDGNTMGFYLMGLLIMNGSYLMAQVVINDSKDGAIVRILTAPVTQLSYYASNLLANMVPLLAQLLLVGILGMSLYDWSLGFAASLLLTYALFTAASVAFAFTWNALFKNKASGNGAFFSLMTVIAFIGGFMVPLELLPEAVSRIGAIFPASWLSRSIGVLLDRGANAEFWWFQGILILFTGVYLLFGGKRRLD